MTIGTMAGVGPIYDIFAFDRLAATQGFHATDSSSDVGPRSGSRT